MAGVRGPLKRHGGKSYLARRFADLMPPHACYVEPFLGGGSVLLAKAPADRELAGDIDADLMNFWSDLARYPEALCHHLGCLRYERGTFEAALRFPEPGQVGAFERSVAFLVRNRMSRGGLGKSFAWSNRLRGGQPGDVNGWETALAELPAIARRVARVEFHYGEATDLIRANDHPSTLFYCDPPYLHETRTARSAYAHEMGREAHERLLGVLLGCRGMVMLSGYRSGLYDSLLSSWERYEFDVPNNSGQGKTKQRRVECLWASPAAVAAGCRPHRIDSLRVGRRQRPLESQTSFP